MHTLMNDFRLFFMFLLNLWKAVPTIYKTEKSKKNVNPLSIKTDRVNIEAIKTLNIRPPRGNKIIINDRGDESVKRFIMLFFHSYDIIVLWNIMNIKIKNIIKYIITESSLNQGV